MLQSMIISGMLALATMLPAGSGTQADFRLAAECYSTATLSSPVPETTHLWCITNKTATLYNGYKVDKGTYMRVVRENPKRDYYTVEWYGKTTRLNKADAKAYTVTPDDEVKILMKKTAGVINA